MSDHGGGITSLYLSLGSVHSFSLPESAAGAPGTCRTPRNNHALTKFIATVNLASLPESAECARLYASVSSL